MILEVRLNEGRFRLNIIVDKHNKLAFGHANTGIACSRRTRLLLQTEFQILIGSRLLLKNTPRVINGIVIDNDNFVLILGNCLGFNTLDGLSDQAGAILCGNDNTNPHGFLLSTVIGRSVNPALIETQSLC